MIQFVAITKAVLTVIDEDTSTEKTFILIIFVFFLHLLYCNLMITSE